MLSLFGAGVGNGIAIGKAVVHRRRRLEVPEYTVAEHLLEEEVGRLRGAMAAARGTLVALRSNAAGLRPDVADIIEAHLLMLEDPLLSDQPEHLIRTHRINAEQALRRHGDGLLKTFNAIEDDYLRAKKNDIHQVVNRVLDELMGGADEGAAPAGADTSSIITADDLSPADTVLLKSRNVRGFATNLGGPISHTAILARGLGIPAVVGLHGAVRYIRDGETVVVDGKRGLVLVDPDQQTLEEYRARRERIRRRRQQLTGLRDNAAETRDGHRATLLANIGLPDEIAAVNRAAAAGVGLYRTEYLFVNRERPPGEDEQYEAYHAVVRAMQQRPVTIRTLDLGADKRVNDGRAATNPALGQRAVRLCLNNPALFRPQLRAILRASAHGPVRLMIPMLSSLDELQQTLELLDETRRQLQSEGLPYDRNMAVGGMIEVPAAAIAADLFARRLDFLSIGTNDLIQYTLAIDRVDDDVNYLYDPLHPSVLRLIETTIRAGREAGVPVNMCGEMAGDVAYTRLLLGLGLDVFSMEPSSIPEVKQVVRATDHASLAAPVREIMRSDTPRAIREQLRQLNAGLPAE